MGHLLWLLNLAMFRAFPAHNHCTGSVNHRNKISALGEPSLLSPFAAPSKLKEKLSGII